MNTTKKENTTFSRNKAYEEMYDNFFFIFVSIVACMGCKNVYGANVIHSIS